MRKLFNSDLFLLPLLTALGVLVLSLFTRSLPAGLYFVDSARYADIARNLTLRGEFKADFAFPRLDTFTQYDWFVNLPPLQIQTLSLAFNLLGINDRSVSLTSMFFFLASLPLVFLLARKLFNRKVALFSALFYLFSYPLLSYAKDGGAESLFIFELLLISYLVVINKRWSFFLAGLFSGLAIFTKLQSYLFIFAFSLWIFLLHRKSLFSLGQYLLGIGLVLLVHKLGLLFSYYQLEAPIYLAFQQTPLFPADDLARSNKVTEINPAFFASNLKVFLSKIFYNLYNFYKSIFSFDNLLPQFANPVVVVTFLLSFTAFMQKQNREVKAFRIVVLVMFLGSLVLAAATSPQIRYLHYTLPFVIILGVDFLDNTAGRIVSKNSGIALSAVLVAFFVIPFLGRTALDARFINRLYNPDQPYAQKVLGSALGDLTENEDVVVTNLDTWGAWYGNRKTILLPLDLKVLEELDNGVKINAVYLADFQRDNPDHPLKDEWGEMFDNPQGVKNQFIDDNFNFSGEGVIPAGEVYENQPYIYKLWIRKR